jgi:hypothetical protein
MRTRIRDLVNPESGMDESRPGIRDEKKSYPGSAIASMIRNTRLGRHLYITYSTRTVLLEMSSIHRCGPHLIHHIHSLCIAQFVQNGCGVTIF